MRTFKTGWIAASIAGFLLLRPTPSAAMVLENRLEDILVHIQLGDERACGFIVEMDNQNYVVTSASKVSGHSRMTFKTLFGEALKPVQVELSLHRDMARFLIGSAESFKTASVVEEGQRVEVLDYDNKKRDVKRLPANVSERAEHYFVIGAVTNDSLYGAPVLDEAGSVIGVTSVEKSYMIQDEMWCETVKQLAYPLEDVQWQALSWKQYNSRYGGLLKEAEAFRNELYGLTWHWVDQPTVKIDITSEMNLDVERWIKKHNGMVNSLQNSRQMSSESLSGDRFRVVRKVYKESGAGLIEMAMKKTSTLDRLAEEKNALPYLKEEFRRLSFELKIYMIYVREHMKNSKDMWW